MHIPFIAVVVDPTTSGSWFATVAVDSCTTFATATAFRSASGCASASVTIGSSASDTRPAAIAVDSFAALASAVAFRSASGCASAAINIGPTASDSRLAETAIAAIAAFFARAASVPDRLRKMYGLEPEHVVTGA